MVRRVAGSLALLAFAVCLVAGMNAGNSTATVLTNALLAMAPIVNYSRPEPPTRRRVFVHAAYGVPPERVKGILREAMLEQGDAVERGGLLGPDRAGRHREQEAER